MPHKKPLDKDVVDKTILDVDRSATEDDLMREVDEDEDFKQLRDALQRMSEIVL